MRKLGKANDKPAFKTETQDDPIPAEAEEQREARPPGEQEMEILRWIGEHGPATVGETTEGFGSAQGLARSTVVTMMERLRIKGYLTRKKHEGVFRYAAADTSDTLLKRMVQRFVDRTLAGSLSPLIAYFADTKKLSQDEIQQLESLIAKLENKPGENAGEAEARD